MGSYIRNSVLALIASGALGFSVPAEANEDSLQVTLELADQTKRLAPLSLSLTLSGTEGCASVDDRRASGELHVQVCRDGGDDRTPVLSFHIDRVLNLEKGTERRQFRVKLKMAVGKSQLIGRFGEGDTAMELTASVRSISAASLGSGSRSP